MTSLCAIRIFCIRENWVATSWLCLSFNGPKRVKTATIGQLTESGRLNKLQLSAYIGHY